MKINLGFSSENELLDLIEQWHEEQPNCKLYEFIGVSKKDLDRWWEIEASDDAKYCVFRIKTK